MEKSFKDGEIVICNILKTPTIVKMFRFKTGDENECWVMNSNFETIRVDKKCIHKADVLEVNSKSSDVKKNKMKFTVTKGLMELLRRKSKYKILKIKISPIADAYILCSKIKVEECYGGCNRIIPLSATVYPSGRFFEFKDEVSKSWAALHNKQYSV